jgi:hypothetical protein
MHNLHAKTLKRIFNVEDDRTAKFSNEVVLRVERAEKRMVNCCGHFMEFSADTLLAIVADISDEDAMSASAPDPDEKVKVDYKKLSKAELIILCDKTDGIEIRGDEKHPMLVEILEKHDSTEA